MCVYHKYIIIYIYSQALMSKNGNICKGIIESSQQPQQLHRKDNQMIPTSKCNRDFEVVLHKKICILSRNVGVCHVRSYGRSSWTLYMLVSLNRLLFGRVTAVKTV